MKYLLTTCLLFCIALSAGCSVQTASPSPAQSAEVSAEPDMSSVTVIDLNAPEDSAGISLRDGMLSITQAGTYRLSGSLSGSIQVNAPGSVELILNGVSVTGQSCLSILSKDPVTITAEAGTENTLSDGSGEPGERTKAVVYSVAPLTLRGDGTLTVQAGSNNGIQSKNTLTVSVSTLQIAAANNALKSKGILTVSGGDISIVCGGDGLATEAGRIAGSDMQILGGSLSIISDNRGLDADGALRISGGDVAITCLNDGIRATTFEQSGGNIFLTNVPEESSDHPGELGDSQSEISDSSIDGICADTISLLGGQLTVNAVDDAIQATCLVCASGGTSALTAGGDGISCDGDVTISDGLFSIISQGDGIQALTVLTIDGGVFDIVTGGGGGTASSKSGDDFGFGWNQTSAVSTPSAKGLKSDADITINGGTLDLNASDDSIHSTRLCTINGGDITICSSDDAIHSDDMLVINNGNINITDCFEGLEAYAIEVNGGSTLLRAVNDGVNANGSEGAMFGFPGGAQQTVTEDDFDSISGAAITYYRQTGGTVDLVVTGNANNAGDGVDSNGSVYIDGGVLTVSTFGNTREGGIDYGQGEFVITGGMVMAGGASMMQESLSESSTQCSAILSVNTQSGGTEVTITDSDGNEIWSYTMANTFNCLVLSHPCMTIGNTYTVTYGTASTTLDFTETSVINMAGGMMGFGGMPF